MNRTAMLSQVSTKRDRNLMFFFETIKSFFSQCSRVWVYEAVGGVLYCGLRSKSIAICLPWLILFKRFTQGHSEPSFVMLYCSYSASSQEFSLWTPTRSLTNCHKGYSTSKHGEGWIFFPSLFSSNSCQNF